jgi:hypothetical protein
VYYVITNSAKPVKELTWSDVGFRKVSDDVAALFVSTSANGAKKYIERLADNGLIARGLSAEDIQVLQMNLSAGSLKFGFEVLDPISGLAVHHTSVHTIR